MKVAQKGGNGDQKRFGWIDASGGLAVPRWYISPHGQLDGMDESGGQILATAEEAAARFRQ